MKNKPNRTAVFWPMQNGRAFPANRAARRKLAAEGRKAPDVWTRAVGIRGARDETGEERKIRRRTARAWRAARASKLKHSMMVRR